MSTESSSSSVLDEAVEAVFNSGTDALAARFNIMLKFPSSLQCKSKDYLLGPKVASMKLYSNSVASKAELEEKLLCFPESNSCNPIQEDIVTQLREKFGSLALFFWNDTIGDQVGVILKPAAFLPSGFSALGAKHMMPLYGKTGSGTRAIPDVSALAAEMYLVGGGRFSDISFQ
jgi:hypothetical protein